MNIDKTLSWIIKQCNPNKIAEAHRGLGKCGT